jgi:hypothetical protein
VLDIWTEVGRVYKELAVPSIAQSIHRDATSGHLERSR